MTLYYILAVGKETSEVVGIYTGKAEFEDALENLPDDEEVEYNTGELTANETVLCK